MEIIKRDIYLNRLIERRENGLIKVVTGIRRCGKILFAVQAVLSISVGFGH